MLKYIALSLLFVTSTLAGRIVGGDRTDIRQHPHQVSLQLRKPGSYYHVHKCGCTIIKKDCVLSAGHCIEQYRAKHYRIAAGSTSLNDPNAVKVNVREIITHDKFIAPTYENDVALVFLVKSLPINHVTIAPIALATEAPKHGSLAKVIGWGATSHGAYGSSKLFQINVPIVSNDRCDAAYTLIYGRSCITSDMICAGYEGVGGKDSCEGDSGGSITFNATLVGVVSWGFECARPDAPGVYASVPHLYNWIVSLSGLQSVK